MKNLILASVLCLLSFVLSAKTVSFYAPKNGGTNGLVLVAAGDRQKPYWANVVGDKMYQHNIFCWDDDNIQFITFSFINNIPTAYTTGAAVSQALYNLGHTNQYTSVSANGNTGATFNLKGGYASVYGSNVEGRSFYFFKVTNGAWSYEAWDNEVVDTVTPVSHSTLAVNSGVNASGLSFNDIYPVGSIYFNVGETLPPIFTAEGRTWVKITNGTFLMSADGTTTVAGATGGANSKTLVEGNIPAHTHSVSGTTASESAHTHGVGSYTITGQLSALYEYTSGPFSGTSKWGAVATSSSGDNHFGLLGFSATSSKGFSGSSAAGSAHSHSYSTTSGSTGSGTSFDNRPSFLAVSMWKRTN